MKTFKIVITETSSKAIEVQANNKQEALEIAEEMYKKDEAYWTEWI